MRFNNEMYLKAFPREDKPAPAAQTMTNKPQPAGDVFDEEIKPDLIQDPDQEEVEDHGDQSGQSGAEA